MSQKKPNLKLIVKMIKQQAALGNIYTSFMEIEKLIQEEFNKQTKEEPDA